MRPSPSTFRRLGGLPVIAHSDLTTSTLRPHLEQCGTVAMVSVNSVIRDAQPDNVPDNLGKVRQSRCRATLLSRDYLKGRPNICQLNLKSVTMAFPDSEGDTP